MATTLQSPGALVTVVNESFYTPAAPGTVPLIVVASAANKTNPSGTTAVGTIPANAGTVYLVTSQRDLTDTFGTPLFYTDSNGNPINGGELNEYGLQAAYSLLGVSSAAYIVNSPVDLSALVANSSVPAGAPADGSYWLDTTDTDYGIFEWYAPTGTFTNKSPLVIDDSNSSIYTSNADGLTPAPSFGAVGQYTVVSTNQNTNVMWYKNTDGNWVKVGSIGEGNFASNSASTTFASTVWSTSWPTALGTQTSAISVAGTFTINTHAITVSAGSLSTVATSVNGALHTFGIGAKIVNGALALYADSTAASNGSTADGKIVIASTLTTLLNQLGLSTATYVPPTVFVGPHTQYPNFSSNPSGSVYVKTTSPNLGQNWIVKRWSASNDAFTSVTAPVYSGNSAATYGFDPTGGGVNIPLNSLYIESNFDQGNNTYVNGADYPVLAEFKIKRRVGTVPTVIVSTATTSTVHTGTIQVSVSVAASSSATTFQNVAVTGGPIANLAQAINNSGITNLSATVNTNGTVSIQHNLGGEIRFIDSGTVLSSLFTPGATSNFYAAGAYEPLGTQFKASNWMPLSYTSSPIEPTTTATNGQIWYSSIVDQVDVMWHNGQKWQGYLNAFPTSNPTGPIVAALAPTTQTDGTPLVNGDIWISTANLDQYGQLIYVYSSASASWVQQDPTDHTSPNGWVFADARWSTNGQASTAGTIVAMLSSDFVDPDAPDPALYPRGTRLWNLRRSGFNLKEYVSGYININANNGFNLRVPTDSMANYNKDRWVTISPNSNLGVGTFGRLAQRSYVVKNLKATLDSNTTIRDTDNLTFNLIACPGYPETIQNMIGLNTDRGQTAFVVGDTPFRLASDATILNNWGHNTAGALDNGDQGIVSFDDYTAVWYPSGFTNDLTGNNIVVPPSHMMLQTILQSDQVSYPWFAPAGTRRGVVTNVDSVGYINSQGEFVPASLPQGIRDVMAPLKINPIATLNGSGPVAMAQYTRTNVASSLDRINVARLVAHIRRQVGLIVSPYLFEPNDSVTRAEVKNAIDSFFLELVGQRAIYDFITVCDTSNNTPDRIDRSELWVDIAIEPTKAVEFIYVPIRLVNTGSIAAGTYTLD